MHQHQHLAVHLLCRRHGVRCEHPAPKAQTHGRRQRVIAFQQAVTHDTVECGQHRFALGRLLGRVDQRLQQRLQPGKGSLQPLAHQFRDTVHGAIDKSGDATGLLRLATGHAHDTPDRLVDAFGNPGHAARGLRGQLRRCPQIGRLQMLDRSARRLGFGHV